MSGVFESMSVLPVGAISLVPGYVWLQTELKFVPRSKTDQIERFFAFVVYSLVAYSVCYMVFAEEIRQAIVAREVDPRLIARCLGVCAACGIVGGLATGVLKRWDLLGTALSLIGLTTVHPLDTGWDRAFSRRTGCVVRITFKNGVERYGILGIKSLVSTSADERDIFLEKTYCENKQGELVPEVATEGIWIPSSEIALVRFYSWKGLDSDESRATCKANDASLQRGDAPIPPG